MGEEERMPTKEGSDKISNAVFWKNLVIRYWYIVLILGAVMVGAIIGFVLTLDWYVRTSAIGWYGTWTFNDFSLGEAALWLMFLLLWMLLFVVLPTLAVGGTIVAIVWFVVLPPDIKEEIKTRPKGVRGGKRSGGGGAIGFLLFVGLCIKVWVDGNWFTKFGSLSYSYFIQSWIIVFIWALVLIGIPGVIIGIIWLVRKCGRTI
jgi:hypothetical protein